MKTISWWNEECYIEIFFLLFYVCLPMIIAVISGKN